MAAKKAAKKPARKARSGTATAPAPQIPLVDYLRLGQRPHLRANECTNCGARFFDR